MTKELPRPARLNNPGDLDNDGKTTWLGQMASPDPRFLKFESPAYGFRALAKVLLTYVRNDNCKTVRQIVTRFAPPSENNTQAYIEDVCTRCMEHPDDTVDITSYRVMYNLCRAIAAHEGGMIYFTPQHINDGLAMLGIKPPVSVGC